MSLSGGSQVAFNTSSNATQTGRVLLPIKASEVTHVRFQHFFDRAVVTDFPVPPVSSCSPAHNGPATKQADIISIPIINLRNTYPPLGDCLLVG
jgi:hypothetical protein